MYPRQPSYLPALGLNVAGSLAGLPEHHPYDKAPVDLYPVLHPTTGAAPFTLEPDSAGADPRQLTQNPIVTSSSVVAVKFAGGVVIAADALASYGHTLRFKNMKRLHKVNETCVIGAGGEMSDFAFIQQLLEEFTMDDFCADDGISLSPSEIHSILCRVMYNRRTKMDPLWNSVVVAGMQDGSPFLGMVGMIGTHYTDDHIATGFGNHLMRPILREHYRPDMTKEEAVKLIETCLRMGFYRDAGSINKYRIAICSAEGVTISEPFALDTKWDYQVFAHPTEHSPNAW